MSDQRDQNKGLDAPKGSSGDDDRASHLGYVAHEIRNPLSTALWTAELMARLPAAERGGARGEKLAAICLRSVGRVRLLVEDHLLCERLDAGQAIRAEAVPLAEVLGALQARWPADQAALTLPPDQGLAALADRNLLERALDGLLAVAGADGVPVRVELEASGDRLELRVFGAPPQPLDDPGRGAPSDQRGRALALAMARRVAKALGGSLAVDGEGYLLAIPAA